MHLLQGRLVQVHLQKIMHDQRNIFLLQTNVFLNETNVFFQSNISFACLLLPPYRVREFGLVSEKSGQFRFVCISVLQGQRIWFGLGEINPFPVSAYPPSALTLGQVSLGLPTSVLYRVREFGLVQEKSILFLYPPIPLLPCVF